MRNDGEVLGTGVFTSIAMIEKIFRSAFVCRRMVASQLGIIIEGFVLDLHARGHVLTCIQSYAQVVEHFSRWLTMRSLPVEQIDDSVVGRLYVQRRAPGLKPASLRVLSVALRDLMRFLCFRGEVTENCVAGVPRPAPWPRHHLPEVFQPAELKTFLQSFDRTTGVGRRDYAMALGLTQLGLRVQEIAMLQLDDLDCQRDALRLRHTKQRRDRLLPMTAAFAKAIASYLDHGRPLTRSSAVFVRHRAPLGDALQAHHVRNAMRRALARAGLKSSRVHLFRHTFATQLHQRGIGLKAIADLLGHQCLDTTANYARVNLDELRQASLPWPERWR